MEGIEDRVLMDILSRAVGPECARIAFDALSLPPSVSIRYNPLKFRSDEPGNRVPWCEYGRILPERPKFVMDPLFHAGCYYVQDSSAMVVGHILREHLDRFEGLGRPVRVLDLCAAPGGKTTDIATSLRDRFGDSFQLVANEVMRNRAAILADNVAIWGDPNVIVTSCDPKAFSRLEGYFDIIVTDVPCSGEGMFRKDPKAVEDWSPEAVDLCAARQKRILADVWPALREDGLLIYSTCTFEEAENDENVEWATAELGGEVVDYEYSKLPGSRLRERRRTVRRRSAKDSLCRQVQAWPRITQACPRWFGTWSPQREGFHPFRRLGPKHQSSFGQIPFGGAGSGHRFKVPPPGRHIH